MNTLAAAGGLLAIAIFSTAGGPSLSSALRAPESRFTDLSPEACRLSALHGLKSLADLGKLSCPGLGGARVVLSVRADRTALGFAWSSQESVEDVVRGRSYQPAVEWRGVTTARGFEPYAAIVRVLHAAPAVGSSIAVVRVRPGEACLLAEIDAADEGDAAEAARRLADREAPGRGCGHSPARSVLGS